LTEKNSKLKIISLGGLDEIGKNMTVLEFENDIIIIDCGLAFPDSDMYGIDLVIPDFSYVIANKKKVRGLILTHGHEDHIGAVSYLLKNMSVKIFGTKLTLGLLENKLKEHNVFDSELNRCVRAGQVIKLGVFSIEFIHTTHSIADSVALAINTPVGMVVHSGDFKIDYTPIEGSPINLQRFAEIGRRGVLAFLCESTNVESKGYSLSERTVGNIFEQIFTESLNQRIIIATFSSNVHRVQQIINAAHKYKRKVAIIGRSMVNATNTAVNLGYMNIPKNIIISSEQIKRYAPEKLVIATTGSQGETMSALSRMASSDHRQVIVMPNDKIIISSSAIPGNEKTVSKVIDALLKLGAEVVYEKLTEVHVSGHAKQEEIKLLHALLKPKYLIPVHGEYRHLKYHKDLAISMGMEKNNIFVMKIGEVLELTKKSAEIKNSVQAGPVLIDGININNKSVLRDRQNLSQDGLVIIHVLVKRETGVLLNTPEIITRGLAYSKDVTGLITGIKNIITKTIGNTKGSIKYQWPTIKKYINDNLSSYVWQKTKHRPVIISIVTDI